MSKHQTKPGGKAGQRVRKLDPPQSQKPDQAPNPMPAQPSAEQGPIAAAVVSSTTLPSPAVPVSPDAFPARAMAPASTPSIDFQTIAIAYGDYIKQSFEQTKSFVEKLAGVRSLDKAIEIQTEFAKQAYETFITKSQKIRELYSGLAKQSFDGAIAGVIPAAR